MAAASALKIVLTVIPQDGHISDDSSNFKMLMIHSECVILVFCSVMMTLIDRLKSGIVSLNLEAQWNQLRLKN